MSKNQLKVFVVGSASYYADFIKDRILVDDIKDADIVLFTGGEDVDPSLYHAKKLDSTYSNIDRDNEEMEIAKKITTKQLALGICRGSQFLCVLNGGKLLQDIKHHAISTTHKIIVNNLSKNNFILQITSTHHQAAYPYDLSNKDYTLVAYTPFGPNELPCGRDEEIEETSNGISFNTVENYGLPEIVLYHRTNLPVCLGIQGHPEMMPNDHNTVIYLNTLINKLVETIKKDYENAKKIKLYE